MGMTPFNSFKAVLLVMLFYSLAITLILTFTPTDAIEYVDF